MRYLTKADVCEVAGLTPKQLEGWCKQGVIVPAAGGQGHGSHRQFTVVQAVALAYACNWRKCGADLDMMRDIVSCVTSFDENALKLEFDANRRITFLIPGAETKLTEVPEGVRLPYLLDLEQTYRDVTQRVADVERRAREQPTAGRQRGLASSKGVS